MRAICTASVAHRRAQAESPVTAPAADPAAQEVRGHGLAPVALVVRRQALGAHGESAVRPATRTPLPMLALGAHVISVEPRKWTWAKVRILLVSLVVLVLTIGVTRQVLRDMEQARNVYNKFKRAAAAAAHRRSRSSGSRSSSAITFWNSRTGSPDFVIS